MRRTTTGLAWHLVLLMTRRCGRPSEALGVSVLQAHGASLSGRQTVPRPSRRPKSAVTLARPWPRRGHLCRTTRAMKGRYPARPPAPRAPSPGFAHAAPPDGVRAPPCARAWCCAGRASPPPAQAGACPVVVRPQWPDLPAACRLASAARAPSAHSRERSLRPRARAARVRAPSVAARGCGSRALCECDRADPPSAWRQHRPVGARRAPGRCPSDRPVAARAAPPRRLQAASVPGV
jgi:hypothetical protein